MMNHRNGPPRVNEVVFSQNEARLFDERDLLFNRVIPGFGVSSNKSCVLKYNRETYDVTSILCMPKCTSKERDRVVNDKSEIEGVVIMEDLIGPWMNRTSLPERMSIVKGWVRLWKHKRHIEDIILPDYYYAFQSFIKENEINNIV